jgi:hypothetical protein
MKSKLVKIWGTEEALSVFKENPGIALSIKVLNINETAFIRFIIKECLDKNLYPYIISPEELNALEDKLKTYISYDAEN